MTPPKFVPFEAMTEQEQIEHVIRVHEIGIRPDAESAAFWHRDGIKQVTPHTHDKQATS